MKKIVSCALAALLAVTVLAVPALAIDLEPGTGDGFYVRDTANVLSSETEELVAAYNASVLEPLCDEAQLVVVTVRYLEEDSDLAATELLNDWGVGGAQSNGMLLLLVTEEYRGWLAVGQGLSAAFDDDTAGRYLDEYFWDYIDKDEFDEGVQTLATNLGAWYADHYDADLSSLTGGQDSYYESYPGYGNYSGYGGYDAPAQSVNTGASGFVLAVFVVLLLLFLWALGAMGRFTRMRRWGYTGGFFPIFWFGGGRRYRSYRDRFRGAPPPPPAPGPRPGPGGPAGFGGFGGFMGGGVNRTGGAGRRTSGFRSSSGSSFRSSGGFRGGGFHGGGHGGGFGGHSGGGGAGRR